MLTSVTHHRFLKNSMRYKMEVRNQNLRIPKNVKFRDQKSDSKFYDFLEFLVVHAGKRWYKIIPENRFIIS